MLGQNFVLERNFNRFQIAPRISFVRAGYQQTVLIAHSTFSMRSTAYDVFPLCLFGSAFRTPLTQISGNTLHSNILTSFLN